MKRNVTVQLDEDVIASRPFDALDHRMYQRYDSEGAVADA